MQTHAGNGGGSTAAYRCTEYRQWRQWSLATMLPCSFLNHVTLTFDLLICGLMHAERLL